MSIKIDDKRCISCGNCTNVCPGSLISQDAERRAYLKYPKDCWGCTACVKECSVGAIQFYLGSDIGGKGGYLYVSKNDNCLNWHIVNKDGHEKIIKINRKESNKY
ncbi:MAG: ferredoxin [uncultured bacterium]|nr:MAG: ferredoxin [uncultured bacterium]HBH18979.1 adenylylsulfate reductase [Cyanobacteria bacterium UBA9579]